jgi:hypothetical protein
MEIGMNFPEDLWKGPLGTGLAITAGVAVLPVLAPSLAGPLRSMLSSGISLLLEAEFDAEGEIIGNLVQQTVSALISGLTRDTHMDSATRRRRMAERVRRFERTARQRAARHGWSEQDKARRYQRHIAQLRRALAKAEQNRPQSERQVLNQIYDVIEPDW